MSFAKYITSINNTEDRSVEELIALYRFWPRKGLVQTTLALFKKNCHQREISRYLAQIRNAILKDFLPYFLGAESRSRDFLIQHNNQTSIIVNNLHKYELVVVADATYTRIEKSSNNNFQYNTWSQQKMDLNYLLRRWLFY